MRLRTLRGSPETLDGLLAAPLELRRHLEVALVVVPRHELSFAHLAVPLERAELRRRLRVYAPRPSAGVVEHDAREAGRALRIGLHVAREAVGRDVEALDVRGLDPCETVLRDVTPELRPAGGGDLVPLHAPQGHESRARRRVVEVA